MKELRFVRTGRMHVAHQGNRRFTVWRDKDGPVWHAAVWPRNARRPDQVIDQAQALSRAEAIDWCAKRQEPETPLRHPSEGAAPGQKEGARD